MVYTSKLFLGTSLGGNISSVKVDNNPVSPAEKSVISLFTHICIDAINYQQHGTQLLSHQSANKRVCNYNKYRKC